MSNTNNIVVKVTKMCKKCRLLCQKSNNQVILKANQCSSCRQVKGSDQFWSDISNRKIGTCLDCRTKIIASRKKRLVEAEVETLKMDERSLVFLLFQ